VIEVFGRRGFLILSEEADPLVDISHESLIRLWKRLKEWVAEEGKSGDIYQRLVDQALNRPRDLYRGASLAEALDWEKTDLPNESWAGRYHSDPKAYSAALDFLRRSEKRRVAIRTGLI